MKELLTNLHKLPFGPQEVSIVGGHFDLIHPGHMRYLKECKRQAEGPLVVLLANDEATSRRKPGRPIISELDRAEMLLGLECVDYVHICSQEIDDRTLIYGLMAPKKVFFPIETESNPLKEALMQLLQQRFPEIQLVPVTRQRADISTTQIIKKIMSIPSQVNDKSKNKEFLKNNQEIKSYLEELSKQSEEELKVAAILINNVTGEVLSTGHNSVAEHEKNKVLHRKIHTSEHRMEAPRAHHAEIAAVCNFVRNGQTNFNDLILVSKVEPCAGCTQAIVHLGIKKVRYFEDFDNNYGTLILKKAGVDIQKI